MGVSRPCCKSCGSKVSYQSLAGVLAWSEVGEEEYFYNWKSKTRTRTTAENTERGSGHDVRSRLEI